MASGPLTPEQLANQVTYARLPRNQPGRRKSLTQVLNMQDAVYETCMMLRDDMCESTDKEERARIASAIASTCKGWDSLEDRKRVIRGQPLPGSLRPIAKPKKVKSARATASEQPADNSGGS